MDTNRLELTLSTQQLQELFDTSSSKNEILQKLKIHKCSWRLRELSYIAKILNIDQSKLNFNRHEKLKNLRINKNKLQEIPIEQVFCKHGHPASGTMLREKIFKYNLIPYVCYICNNTGIHLDKPLTLQLDHIDGNSSNNLLENLRFLCPNCHSQTPTYGSKNIKKSKNKKQRIYKSKIDWPSVEELTNLVNSHPLTELSKILHVSDNGIRKFCNKHNIPLKPKGFWIKNNPTTSV